MISPTKPPRDFTMRDSGTKPKDFMDVQKITSTALLPAARETDLQAVQGIRTIDGYKELQQIFKSNKNALYYVVHVITQGETETKWGFLSKIDATTNAGVRFHNAAGFRIIGMETDAHYDEIRWKELSTVYLAFNEHKQAPSSNASPLSPAPLSKMQEQLDRIERAQQKQINEQKIQNQKHQKMEEQRNQHDQQIKEIQKQQEQLQKQRQDEEQEQKQKQRQQQNNSPSNDKDHYISSSTIQRRPWGPPPNSYASYPPSNPNNPNYHPNPNPNPDKSSQQQRPTQPNARAKKKNGKYNPETELIIRGMPYRTTEDTKKIIEKIAYEKGLRLTRNDFECVRAIKRGTDQTQHKYPPNIIVTFHDEQDKRDFRKMTRLTARDIDPTFSEEKDSPIYINENLPPRARTLLYHARSKKKVHGWKYAWTEDGIVYIRKTEDEEKIQINELADLEKEQAENNPPGMEDNNEEKSK